MEKVIVKFSINGNVFTWNEDRDLCKLYKMGAGCVRSGKKNSVNIGFRVYEADGSHLCLLAMFSRQSLSGEWIARLSRFGYYSPSEGMDL